MSSKPLLVERLQSAKLTAAERRVADVLVRDPDALSFGTVADIATASATGGATVMRLAAKLGFDGYRELQDAARDELSRKLRPAASRVRIATAGDDPIERALAFELANVQASVSAIDAKALRTAADRLLRAHRVGLVASDAATGVTTDFAAQLSMVRPDVTQAQGGAAALVRSLAWLGPKDVLVVIDIARYETSVIDAVNQAHDAGTPVLAISDSPLSPVATQATQSFVVTTDGPGPFDSLVGVLCVTNLLVAACVTRRGPEVTTHLDRLEETWTALGTLSSE